MTHICFTVPWNHIHLLILILWCLSFLCYSLVADTLVFNSQYNKNSFLENISTFLKLIPDYRPRNLAEKLAPKCKVVHFPLSLPPLHVNSSAFCKTMPGEQVEISDENLLTDKENSCLANSLATDYLASLQVDNYPSSTQKRSLDEGCLSGLVSKCSKLSNADQEDGNLQEKAEEKNENNDNIPSVPPSIEPESKPLHIVWPHRWWVVVWSNLYLLCSQCWFDSH